MNLQAIIFDLDGVIADSEGWWDDIDNDLLASHGAQNGPQHKPFVLGMNYKIALQYYKETFNLAPTIEELLRQRQHFASHYYNHHISLFVDVPLVLQELKAAGLRIGLATSSVGPLVRPFLERHEITGYFEAVVTGEEVEHGKPAPDTYLNAARKLGIAPENCLAVEDSLPGVQSAKSAGMTVAAIPDTRFVDAAQYIGKADYILGRLGEVTALVCELRN
jgi:HAD superfamily hydrolase (TIGR01509 family)